MEPWSHAARKDLGEDLDANLGERREILELAATFATRCADAYRKASDRARKQFDAAVFERLDVKGGALREAMQRHLGTTHLGLNQSSRELAPRPSLPPPGVPVALRQSASCSTLLARLVAKTRSHGRRSTTSSFG
ncbi:MAG: hypothetical protein ACP5PM_02310 [Acidimicrobiales bacterium]